MTREKTIEELEHRWFESDIVCSQKQYIEIFEREYFEYLDCWYTHKELGELIDEYEEYLEEYLKELEEQEEYEADCFENLGLSMWDFVER